MNKSEISEAMRALESRFTELNNEVLRVQGEYRAYQAMFEKAPEAPVTDEAANITNNEGSTAQEGEIINAEDQPEG